MTFHIIKKYISPDHANKLWQCLIIKLLVVNVGQSSWLPPQDILQVWLSVHKVDGFVFTDVDYLFEPPVTTVAPARRRRQAGTTAGVTTAPGETPPAAGETTAMKTGAATNPGSGPPEPEPEPTNPLPPQVM